VQQPVDVVEHRGALGAERALRVADDVDGDEADLVVLVVNVDVALHHVDLDIPAGQ